jgi:hypothetical protein
MNIRWYIARKEWKEWDDATESWITRRMDRTPQLQWYDEKLDWWAPVDMHVELETT